MSQSLRVLMTTAPIGGVWPYTLELSHVLARLGVRVILASMGMALRASQRSAVSQIPNVVIAERAFKLEWMNDPWPAIDTASDWLRRLVNSNAPDLVHCNGLVLAAENLGVPVLCVAHSSLLPWTRAVRAREPGPELDRYRTRAADGLRAADEVIGPTRASLSAILADHGVRRAGGVIPHGRSAAAYPPGAKEPFILATGRLWDEAMALDVLDLSARSVRWPIRVAGPRILLDRPARRAPANLRLLGELEPEQIASLMSQAAIYVLPMRYEPFGQSALEAALAGCALVLADLDTLREVWGDRALYVPPNDPAALARQLEALIEDPDTRANLAARARARALELTPERMAAAYLTLYRDLLARPRTRAPAPDPEVALAASAPLFGLNRPFRQVASHALA